MTIEQQHGRAPDGSGSHPSDQAAMRPDLSGFDPSRIPPGWKLVPTEPTSAMRQAGSATLRKYVDWTNKGAYATDSAEGFMWEAMVKATPLITASPTPGAPLPIETAPRDGTDILLFGRENSRRWCERPPVVAACDPQRWGSDEWFSHDDPDNPVDIHPTHWLPVKVLASADGSPKGQDAGAA